MENLKNWWYELTSEQRTRYKKWAIIITVLTVSYIGYYLKGPTTPRATANVEEQILSLGSDALEQDIRASIEQRVDSALEQQKKMIASLQEQLKSVQEGQQLQKNQQQLANDLANFMPKNAAAYPEASAYPPVSSSMDHLTDKAADSHEKTQGVVLGGISFTEGSQDKELATAAKKKTVFLPPSFMSAKLITGIDARTSHLAEAHPEPIMLRVQAPAVLPNYLKANLKGCFIVADAIGDLAKERVTVRLQSLSCLDQNGTAVINQKIAGFVTDSDGRRDMAGIVVSRAGSHLARSFAAGVIGGFGEAIQSANTVTNINPLGMTQSLKPDGVLKSGIGGGLKSATSDLQQFYLDLAKQAMPVIEVGAAKDVTVVIQEGVELEIKEF